MRPRDARSVQHHYPFCRSRSGDPRSPPNTSPAFCRPAPSPAGSPANPDCRRTSIARRIGNPHHRFWSSPTVLCHSHHLAVMIFQVPKRSDPINEFRTVEPPCWRHRFVVLSAPDSLFECVSIATVRDCYSKHLSSETKAFSMTSCDFRCFWRPPFIRSSRSSPADRPVRIDRLARDPHTPPLSCSMARPAGPAAPRRGECR
jgi:hypothetical protein